MKENAGGAPGGQTTLPKVLVVDDDKDTRVALAEMLGAEGFDVVAVPDGESLRRLKAIAPQVPVIILAGNGDTSAAVQVMKLDAYDDLSRSLQADEILIALRRCIGPRARGAENEGPTNQLGEEGSLRWLMGPSGRVQDIAEQIRQVADSNFMILLQGETGTGKELVARAIHQMSYRRDKPFVALDCGAAPETLIEAELFGYEKGAFTGALRRKNGYFHFAQGGTLFFDEIANLRLTTQAKLLRVLQERRVQRLGGRRATDLDVRILAAYSAPLVDEIMAGRFRQDLYHRLREFVIILPPLRERPEDIPYLAKRFLIETSIELRRPLRGISDEALEFLQRYSWPGNVRELRNVIRRAVVLGSDLIQPTDLAGLFSDSSQTPATPPDPTPPAGLSLKQIAETATAEAEVRAIRRALHTARGKKSEAARLLKVDYKTLHLKMKRYRIYTKNFLM